MPYTLLLADDSATIQRVIELTFADEDVTVVAVSDGDQAIAQLEASAPDIVLADIGMPGKNGYDVAHYVRHSPALAHIPVVLLTGAFEPVDQARVDAAGCDGVLAKPFEPQQIIGRVKELLARPQRVPDDGAAAIADAPPEPPDTETTERGDVSRSLLPAVIERSGYFDRLDAAFSMLASNPPGQAEPPIAASPDPPQPAPGDVDWFDRTTVSGAVEAWDDLPAALDAPHAAADLPLAYEAAQTESSIHAPESVLPDVPPKTEAVAGSAPAAAPDDRLAPIEASQPIEPEAIPVASVVLQAAESPAPNPVALPALADAFAALLAAEQREPLSARSGLWPTTLAPSAEAREELVEEVVRRVLDRLSGTVREAVANIASDVAERVIREEIERIKTSLK